MSFGRKQKRASDRKLKKAGISQQDITNYLKECIANNRSPNFQEFITEVKNRKIVHD